MEETLTPESLRICIVQMDISWEHPQENRSKISNLLREEKGKHDLVILPEMFSTGFSMRAHNLSEPAANSDTLSWMQFEASKLGAVVVGSIIVEEDGKYYNRLLVVNHKGLVLKYDKRHLFRMAAEHEVFTAGQELQIFTLKGWRICPMICYDLRFPVWSRNGLNPQGQLWFDILLYVANWPERRIAHWKALLLARAIENQAWVAGINRVGIDGNDIVYSGDSMLIDANGAILTHSTGKEELLTATLEWAPLAEYREKFPAWADADKFELFG